MAQLVTGEAVALDLRPAAVPTRLLAVLIDLAVEFVALLIGTFALVAVAKASNEAVVASLSVVLFVVVFIGYPVALETFWRGRTLGKAALGLRVVRDDGGPIGFRQAFIRGLIGAIVELPGLTVFTGAVFCSLFNAQGKRLGDLAAGTVVLNERVPRYVGQLPPVPPPLVGWAQTLDLSGLPEDLAGASRSFLFRAAELHADAREELGGRLVAAVSQVVTPDPPPGTPGWAYLTAVLAERRNRAGAQLVAEVPRWAPPPATAPATPTGGFAAPF